MTAKDVYELLQQFIENDFKHLRSKVDWLFYSIILMLLGIITNLILVIVKIL